MKSFLRVYSRSHVQAAARSFAVLSSSAKKIPQGYVCTDCGDSFPKWHGKCPSCQAFNTISEFRESLAPKGVHSPNVSPTTMRSWLKTTPSSTLQMVPLSSIDSSPGECSSLHSTELNTVLGGRGLTRGSSTLFSGAPGVGKSTLLLQMAALLSHTHTLQGLPYSTFFCGGGGGGATSTGVLLPAPPPSAGAGGGVVVYISGEESAAQIKGRAERLGLNAPAILILNETKLEDLLAQLTAALQGGATLSAVFVDSIQTVWTEGLPSAAGTLAQVKECALKLTAFAKASGVPMVMVGHINKSGEIAGPRVLEHIVDCVLFMEGAEDITSGSGGGGGGSDMGGTSPPSHGFRCLRALKNRFGSTSEVGLFELGERGFTEASPARLFLSSSGGGGGDGEGAEGSSSSSSSPPGCAVAVAAEGTRPLCVEVQSLVTRAAGAYPRTRAQGLSIERLHLLSAVLGRHTALGGAFTYQCDALVNVVGGLRLGGDTSTDLALALSMASSATGVPLCRRSVFIGEVGLTGEVRGGVSRLRERLGAASKLGFNRAWVPAGSMGEVGGLQKQLGMVLSPAKSLAQVVEGCGVIKGGGGKRGGATSSSIH